MRLLQGILIIVCVTALFSCSMDNGTRMFDVQVSVSPADAGTILPSADTVFTKDQQVEIRALPAKGYVFSGWSGDLDETINPLNLNVDKDYALTANFKLKKYELKIESYGQGSVSERIVEQKSKDYDYGTRVELTANPVDGWKFVEWRGDIGSTENPVQLTVDQEKHVSAVFEADQLTLTAKKSGEGSLTIVPDRASYELGATVEISASATAGWEFEKWDGDVSGSDNPIALTMDSAIVLTALFTNKTFAGGSGTENNPYKVATLEQLQAVSNHLDAFFLQTNDIDATPTSGWNSGKGFNPIGDNQSPFTGSYDGNGFSIEALYINRSGESLIGLFGETSYSELKSIILNDIFIEEAGTETGALAGKNDGNISFSHASGSIVGLGSTGGLVGENRGFISGSSSSVIIEDKLYGDRKGGLAGSNLTDGEIVNSYADGDVYGRRYANADSRFTGGLVGFNEGLITGSYATGNVEGGESVGGFVGGNSLVAEILDSYAMGNVSGTRWVGGFVGSHFGTARIVRSYATGFVTGEENVGGFVGFFNSSTAIINWGYWDEETSGVSLGAGAGDPNGTIGLTTEEMTGANAEANMTVLDFDFVWATTIGYPILRWQQ